jgi:hypothetical protein
MDTVGNVIKFNLKLLKKNHRLNLSLSDLKVLYEIIKRTSNIKTKEYNTCRGYLGCDCMFAHLHAAYNMSYIQKDIDLYLKHPKMVENNYLLEYEPPNKLFITIILTLYHIDEFTDFDLAENYIGKYITQKQFDRGLKIQKNLLNRIA